MSYHLRKFVCKITRAYFLLSIFLLLLNSLFANASVLDSTYILYFNCILNGVKFRFARFNRAIKEVLDG